MKFTRLLALTLSILLLLPSASILAESEDEIGIIIDDQRVALTTSPIISNSRTLVPLRGVFEQLGAIVDWNQTTQQAIIKNDQIEVLISPDNTAVLLNGELTYLDAAALNVDDRLMIPIRFVAESLGHTVGWDALSRDVIITSNPLVPIANKTTLPLVGDRSSLEHLLQYSQSLYNYVDFRFMGMDVLEESQSTNDLAFDGATEEAMAPEAESAKSSDDYSATNNQVEGVDEGDLVKTDGTHIVVINNNSVKIIDPDPSTLSILSEINVPRGRGYVSNLYLNDNQLILIGTSYVQYGLPSISSPDATFSKPSTYYTSNTFLLVYDISNATDPTLMMDMDYEGSYISSRLIGDDFYMVTQKQLDYWSIDSTTDYAIQPKYANNLTGLTTVIPYDEMHYFPDYIAPSVMMTIGIDLSSKETTSIEAYLGAAETVYATTTEMYLGFTHYEYAKQLTTLIYTPDYTKSTALYQFSLDNGSINYEAKGDVPGTILNQFSLDAYDNHLRVATTTGDMWDASNSSKNNIYILDDSMTLVGELTDLAPGERIYSTRFYQDRIYMVTFRQVDPLFVIDALDPENPELLGYLKVPGFSTYMHLLDKNHILGFGTDTYEQDGGTRTGGIKLSLFDVTDPTSPIESKVEVIGSSGSYSELQYNHKALMISLDKGLMAFPLSVASSTPYYTDFVGAYLYEISEDDFSYYGQVTHKGTKSNNYDATSTINRLLYIDDYLYSFSNEKMMLSDLPTLKTINELEFQTDTLYELPIIEPMIE